MKDIISALKSTLELLTLNPESSTAMYAGIALSLVTAWFAFGKTIKALKFPLNDGSRAAVAFVISVILPLMAAVLTKAYILPRITNIPIARFAPLAAAVLILLAAAAPITCFLLKSKYLQTLASFLAPVISAVIMVFLVKGVFGAVREGDKGFDRTKTRTQGVNELISP